MKQLTGESRNLTAENLKAMQQLFPEAFAEGKIDFEVLRQLLGDFVEDAQERYSFKWNGKGRALRLSQTPSMGTLRPCKEESRNWDTTENLYLEGDNLEVLKLLQKSYYGKVKMIYIDPPYNTGKDFVYEDDFRDAIRHYKELTRQVDGEGNRADTNTETNGRFHTDWLNMMYPRLRLARSLLTEDGVIFISIDDNEQGNLRKICDEIFGENNRVAEIAWQCLDTIKNDAKFFSDNHENIVVYSKNIDYLKIQGVKKGEKQRAYYKNYDNDPRGDYLLTPLHAKSGTQTGIYTYTFSNGQTWTPPQGTYPRFSKDTLEKLDADNRIYLDKNREKTPQKKTFLFEVGDRMPPTTFWNYSQYGSTRQSNKELAELLSKGWFQNPKPTKIVYSLIDLLEANNNAIILDFFSGSATTAHAIMQLNAEDGGKRRFIMVQLPELTDAKSEAYKAGYQNICEIGKERIRRAGDKIKAEAGDKAADLDIGFRVFKLDSSNLQKWNPQPENLLLTLQQATDNFLPDRTEEDVLYEIILKMGLDLSCQIEKEQAAGETVYIIGGGALMICLGQRITTAIAEAMAAFHKIYDSELWQVVFRDTGFASDTDKTNSREILKAAGLEEDSFVCV